MARILVVDDRYEGRELVANVLASVGHSVLEAADGAAALELARAEKPDLIVADILMPVMGGFELVRQLRSDPATIGTRVIFYSAAYSEEELRALGGHCGLAGVLVKPIEPEKILETVNSALASPLAASSTSRVEEFDREHLRLLNEKLMQKVDELEVVGFSLGALVELGQELASEHDPHRLLEKACRGGRELVGARQALLGLLEEGGATLSHVVTSGMDAETAARIGSRFPIQGVLGAVVAEVRPRRLQELNGDPHEVGLPPQHPPLHSFLGVPIAAPAGVHGCLCLSDKLGAKEFSELDEKLAVTIASEAALAFENARRCEEMERHAVVLEQEVNERRRVETELRSSRDEMETRISERTSQLRDANERLTTWIAGLESRNREITLLGEMGNLLQSCITAEEAHEIVARSCDVIFPTSSGALCFMSPSKDLVEAVASWGRSSACESTFEPRECWALRRGRVHLVTDSVPGAVCRHVQSGETSLQGISP